MKEEALSIIGLLALAGAAALAAFRLRDQKRTPDPQPDARERLPVLPLEEADDMVRIIAPQLNITPVNVPPPERDADVTNTIPRTTRGLRNRNPGNIRWIADPTKRWRGMLRNDGTNYAVFDTDANGIRAIGQQLKVYDRRGLRSVRQIISTWAPPSENVTSAYVAAVSRALGVAPDDVIDVNVNLVALTRAIIQHENGLQPYRVEDIALWSRLP